MRRLLVPLLLVLSLLPVSAWAHDYWLAPERFELKVGQALRVDLRLGGHFEAESSRPYEAERTSSFVLVTASETVDLSEHATDGATPILEGLTLPEAGPGLVAMERKWVDIKLADAKFTKYLEHEGLTTIARMRDRQGHRPIERECYMRSLKSLVHVGEGEGSATLHDRVLGHRLEIVLLDDPRSLDAGDELHARVLWRGKPLAKTRVTAHHRAAADQGKIQGKIHTLTAKTDADGRVSFPVQAAGAWLLRLVHMVPCRGCSHTDWESYWTSFSFAID